MTRNRTGLGNFFILRFVTQTSVVILSVDDAPWRAAISVKGF